MDITNILRHVDHTLLSQTATYRDIAKLCDEGMKYNVASVCIPPYYVGQAREYLGGRLKICTVVGFPNGYNTTRTKLFETHDALANGSDEIDMVINVGLVKDREYEIVENEIRSIKRLCEDRILKVIIETCLLDDGEKIDLCNIVEQSGADFIKTSTGFSKSGAKLEDIKLFYNTIGEKVKIKAAGGINSLEEAEEFLNAGADRLGSSRIVKLAEAESDV